MPAVTEKLFPTEVIASILSNLPPRKKGISTNMRNTHQVFFDMRITCKNILSDFRFDRRGTFPYSRTIDQAFSNLETSKILSRTNPDFDRFEVTKNLKQYYEKHVEYKLSPTQLEETKKIAAKLAGIH